MSLQSKLTLTVIICFLLILIQACENNAGEEPSVAPIPPTPEIDRCGDGVCDDKEKENPDLCPEDCYTPGIIESEEENNNTESWFGSASWTCLVDKGEAGQDRFSAEFEFDFSVTPDGTVSGSGWGVFTSAECQLKGCTCQFDPGDLTLSIAGRRIENKLNLHFDPKAPMTQTLNCPNSGTTVVDMTGMLPGCQPATGGLLDFTIPAQDGATHTFRGGLSDNITGEGSVVIHLKNE